MTDLKVFITFDQPGKGGKTLITVKDPAGNVVFYITAGGPIALRALQDFLTTITRERFSA